MPPPPAATSVEERLGVAVAGAEGEVVGREEEEAAEGVT